MQQQRREYSACSKATQATQLGPDNITGTIIDLSNASSIKDFVEEQAALHGGLDILITNTAGPKAGTFDGIELSDLTGAFNQLVAPTFELIKCASKHYTLLLPTT